LNSISCSTSINFVSVFNKALILYFVFRAIKQDENSNKAIHMCLLKQKAEELPIKN
jgi:hypothetical protein